METQQFWISTRNDETNELFKQLFKLSLELEKYTDFDSIYRSEINRIIEAIDQLMEEILHKEMSSNC